MSDNSYRIKLTSLASKSSSLKEIKISEALKGISSAAKNSSPKFRPLNEIKKA